MLNPEDTVLVIVDVQGNLAQRMHQKEMLFENLRSIIRGARVLEIPILWAEQNPQGLGPTIPEVAQLLSPDTQPIPKLSFSCCGCERFMRELEALDRDQVLIAGIEAHVCVYQTALDLLNMSYQVEIVADAVSSRTAENVRIGLAKARDAGAALTSVETALFELLRTAEAPKFKEILVIVK